MRRVLLVTAREYRRMTSLPAFWITALLVPVFVLAAPVAQSLLGGLKTVGYVVIDKSGEYRAPISRRVELAYQRAKYLSSCWRMRLSGGPPATFPPFRPRLGRARL